MAEVKDKAVVEYSTDSGSKVKLSPAIIRRYLVNGGGNVTDQEVMMFLMLCKQQRLDPFLREAYLIKFGRDEKAKATLVTGKEVFTKRAERHTDFRGMHAGVVVQTDDGKLEQRAGSLVLEGETIVGGWAKVWKANREVPYENTVSFNEYVGRKSNGEMNRQWTEKPATMIRKVALVQTLRETFPETFSGMYDADEMSHVESDTLDASPVTMDEPRDVTPEGEPATEPAQPIEDILAREAAEDAEYVTGKDAFADVKKKPLHRTTKHDAEVIDDAKGKAAIAERFANMAKSETVLTEDEQLDIF